MRLQNKTHWRSDQIKPILQRCAEMELEPDKRRRLIVVVSYRRRGGGSSGCAAIGGHWCKVRVSSDVFDTRDFAIVACHEFAHVRGMRHAEMPHYYMRSGRLERGTDSTHPRYDWANSIQVERQQIQSKPKEQMVGQKHQAAVARLKVASTRAKRAVTILKKWQRRVRYYERQMAALKP